MEQFSCFHTQTNEQKLLFLKMIEEEENQKKREIDLFINKLLKPCIIIKNLPLIQQKYWCIKMHWKGYEPFSEIGKECVFSIFCIEKRLDKIIDNNINTELNLPSLPNELWIHMLTFILRINFGN